MGFWDRLKSELVDIIEWIDNSNDTMVFRFEHHNNEIKYGAKLIVREGQQAVFINEGALADVFLPGTHTLETQNMPILSTLKGWKYGFKSPFKAEVYFVSTRQFTDLKWGLKNSLMLRDPEFGPLRLTAFGTYAIKIYDSAAFIREVVGTDGHFTTDEISNQLRNLVVTRFSDALGQSKIPILDLAANYDELSSFIEAKIGHEFGVYGLELTKFLVGNISLPPAVEEALDKRASMGIIGNLSAYTQYQTAEAIKTAASNPRSAAADGMGMGMGFAMANQMANAMKQTQPAASAVPPPIPQAVAFHVAVGGQSAGPYDMANLKQQMQTGQITRETLVWKEGMSQWTPAGQVTELASLFGSTPPPIPKN